LVLLFSFPFTYLVVSRGAPAGDLCVWDAARLEAMGSEGAEGYAGGAVEAADCPPVDWHCEVRWKGFCGVDVDEGVVSMAGGLDIDR